MSWQKTRNKYNFLALFGVFFLSASLLVAVLLVGKPQNIEEKAAVAMCPGAEQCPNAKDPTHLWSCHPPDADGSVQDSLCNAAGMGRRETCGSLTTYYCCNGSIWTTNLSACPTPIPTPAPTINPCLNPNLDTAPWDVDQNGTVNIIDIGIIIDNYKKNVCVAPRADVDGSLTIDIIDIGIVIDHYVL